MRRRGGREGRTRGGRPPAPRVRRAPSPPRPPRRRPGAGEGRARGHALHGAGMAAERRGPGGGAGGAGGAGEPAGGERAPGLRACGAGFACPELETLFGGYALRLEQAAALKALAVLSLLAGSLALAELLLGAPGRAASLARASHPVHCVLFLALLVVTNVRSLRAPQLQQLGRLALLFCLTFALLCCPAALGGPAGAHAGVAAGPVAAERGVWQLLLVTFVSYALLPVRSLLAVGFGLVVAAAHLLVTATLVPAKRPRLWRTVSCRSAPAPLSKAAGPAGRPPAPTEWERTRGARVGGGGGGGGDAVQGHSRLLRPAGRRVPVPETPLRV